MPALQNRKHEAFAREFARTRSACEAYRRTVGGAEPCYEAARALRNAPRIRERISELECEGEALSVKKADLVELHMDVYDIAVRGLESTGSAKRDLTNAERALAGIERLLDDGNAGDGREAAVRVYFDADDDTNDGD